MAWYDIFTRQTAQSAEERALTLPFDVGAAPPLDDNGLHLIPVFAAITLLADSVSTLPVHAYRRVDDDTRQRVALPQLIQSPTPDESFGPWIYRAMMSLLLHGNAYGFVMQRDGFGYPTTIEWLDPRVVSVTDVYRVNGNAVPRDDIVHIKWATLPGATTGLSPLNAARSAIQTGNGSMKYGADWFQNGGVPPGTFVNNERTLTPEDADATAERLRAAIKRGRPLVYGKDWTYQPIQIPPDQAQFVATNKMVATQIAAIYRVPAVWIGGDPGGNLAYTTPELESLHFVTHSLRPWLVRLEDALSALLPNRVYIKFNADALIRVDTLTRYQAYAISRQIGLHNVDELRALEDMPPLPNGQGQSYSPLPPGSGPSTNPPASGPLKEPA